MDNELMQELTDLDVDNLIEKYKELQEEKDRLILLEKQKIEQIKYNGEQIRTKINNNMTYIEEQLKSQVMNSKDKKESKTMFKKSFISGEVQVKKPSNKIENPEIKGLDAYKIEQFKDYCEQIVDYKFKWGELKKVLKIKDNKIINTETGEDFSSVLNIGESPEEVIIK